MNKILILCALLLITLNCKKNIEEQDTSSYIDSSKVKRIETLSNKINDLEKIQNNSFVISCGSSCAMNYSAEQIINDETSIKVKFKVEMYVDEVLSDTYNEVYLFIYDKSNKIDRIELEGTNRNVLETLMPDAQESFKEFSFELVKKSGEENNKKTIQFSNSILPYKKRIDISHVTYKTLSVKTIDSLSEFACNEKIIRYIQLDKTDKINLILVPQDCGDFPYRFYLLTIKDNKVVSNLYVEGELFEPENNKTVEKTSFSIDKNSILTVKTINKDFENGINEENRYKIDSDGKIVKI